MARVTRSIWPILVLAAGLRLAGLGRLCLWYDEAFTAWLARLPVDRMIAATAGDVHPPLWYLIEIVTGRLLGYSEWSLRLPAAILGVLNVWLTWKVARDQHLEERPAWLAALFVAVSPMLLHYSQEARMYQLLLTGVLLMALDIQSEDRPRWRLIVGGLIAVWSHNLGAVYVAVMFAAHIITDWQAARAAHLAGGGWYWLRYRSWRVLLGLTLPAATILVGWSPWLVALVRQADHVHDGFWVQSPTLGTWLYSWVYLAWSRMLEKWSVSAGIVTAFGLAAMAVYAGIRLRVWSLLVWLLCPSLILVIVSLVWRPVYLDRALIGVVPAWCIILAMAVTYNRDVRRAALAALPVLLLAVVGFTGDVYKEPVRDYADVIRAGWSPGDRVFHGNLASYILFDYYLGELDNVVWRQANDLSQSLTDETKAAMDMHQVTTDELVGHRLWIVWSETPMMDPEEETVIGPMVRGPGARAVLTMSDSELLTARIYLLQRGESGFGRPRLAKPVFIR